MAAAEAAEVAVDWVRYGAGMDAWAVGCTAQFMKEKEQQLQLMSV